MINRLISGGNNYDKYEDVYQKYKYINKKLNFTMEFDADWIIITQYQNFDDFQKKFARYFSTAYSELLFIGFNDKKDIGLRATVETLGLSNKKYAEKIKSANQMDSSNYKITILNDQKINLKNVQAYSLVFETAINPKNSFVFDSIIFRDHKNNFRIDMWTDKKNYDAVKDYIFSIYQTIDIIAANKTGDETDDTTDDIKK